MLIHDIKESIILLYRPNIQSLLTMCGFKLGKLTKCRKIELLTNIHDGTDLENSLKQSTLVVLPLNDFPDDLPLFETDTTSNCRSRPSTSTSADVTNDESEFSDQNSFNGSPTVSRGVRNNVRPRVLLQQPLVEHINLSDEDFESDEANITG